jgi:hypothetical protein
MAAQAANPSTAFDALEVPPAPRTLLAQQTSTPAGTAVTADAPVAGTLTPGQVRFRTAAIMLGGIGGVAAYGNAKWWQDGFSSQFKTVKEGWFGQNTENGGADKLGHGFAVYTGTRLISQALQWAGNSPERARSLAFWGTVGTFTGVEILDGFSAKWRFSAEDAVINVAGGLLGYAMETHPQLDALIDVRLQYRPSQGPEGKRDFDPFGDYSGQKYLLAFKASGMPALRERPLLRYLEFVVGYSAAGFEPESQRVFGPPTRKLYAGISLNLAEVLRGTVFKDNAQPSRTQRATETFFELVQIPGTAALVDHTLSR